MSPTIVVVVTLTPLQQVSLSTASGITGLRTYLDDEVVDWRGAWNRVSHRVVLPMRTLYSVVDHWLRDWASPHQARLTAGQNLTSGYELSIELSPEDGDQLLGLLLAELSEESEESRVREVLPGGFGLQ